jgi:hypothetical protein
MITCFERRDAAQIPSGLAAFVVVIRIAVQAIGLHVGGLQVLSKRYPNEPKLILDDRIVLLQVAIFTNGHCLFQY